MDDIIIVAYDLSWPLLFDKEADLIRQALGKRLGGIEHFGSTAVPGLAAKPVIDIMIATRTPEDWPSITESLERLGYVYWRENPDPSRMFFVKGMPPYGKQRTHHIHVFERDGPDWRQRLRFRDYLRTHVEEAERYETLKRAWADKFRQDREGYTMAKTDYIADVMQIADVSE